MRAILAGAILLSACGSLSDEQESPALSALSSSPVPTPGSPVGVPPSGTRRVLDTMAGWSLDIPAAWFDRGALWGVRGHEVWSYDPRADPTAFPLAGEITVRIHLLPDRGVMDLETFADRWVWTATCRPCRKVLESADVPLAGQAAKFFAVHQEQPAGPQRDLEPHLYWLARSPHFVDRVLVVRAMPGGSPHRAAVERMVGTLQFFRPAPAELTPTRTKQQVLDLFAGTGRTITRIEAKLMTWWQWERAHNEWLRATSAASGGPSGTYSSVDPDTLVWVVAYAGSGLTPLKGGPPGASGAISTPRPWLWAISVLPAREPFDWGGPTLGAADTPWPAWFDGLPDSPSASR